MVGVKQSMRILMHNNAFIACRRLCLLYTEAGPHCATPVFRQLPEMIEIGLDIRIYDLLIK